MMKAVFFHSSVVLLILCGGCAPLPFAPIAVPNEYTVLHQTEEHLDSQRDELMKLQIVKQEPYVICPGDSFRIRVYGHPELGIEEVSVTPDGVISIPLVEPVSIGGLTMTQATNLLTEKISRYIRNPQLSLIPLHISGYTYTILGRVNQPGSYPIAVGKTRLLDAIAAGHGFSIGIRNGDTVDLADLDNAYISRQGKILPVNFQKAIAGDPLHNIPLCREDVIFIPSSMSSQVCILGAVMRQSYVGFNESLTAMKALSYVGGLQDTHASGFFVIRGGMKSPTIYKLDIDKMLAGKAQDFQLEANDILYFPNDMISDWNILVKKVIPTIQALSMMAGPFGNPSSFYNNND